MYNKAVLIGRVCTNVTCKTLDNGKNVANFRMETNDMAKQYHAVNCYDRTSETAAELKENDIVFVEGRVVTRSYKDRSGDKKYITSINAARLGKVGTNTDSGSSDEDDDF